MRLAHVDTGRSWRGGQAQVGYLLAGVVRQGHDVMLAAPRGAPLADVARGLGIPVVHFRPRGDLDVTAMVRLGRAVQQFGADLVHAHTAGAHLGAALAGRMADAPVVVTRRLDRPVGQGGLSGWKYRHGVTRFVAISRVVARSLEAGGVESGRIRVVYSGVPVDGVPDAANPHARAAARGALGLASEDLVAGLVGAMTPQKGHDLALAALAGVPGALKLVMIGEGPDRGAIERQVAALGLSERVRLVGFRSDVPALLPGLDFLVAPSRHEGLGTGVLEAMAAGLAVAATRVAEFDDMLEGGEAGLLVAPGDVGGLTAAMSRLSNDPALRGRLAARARERARRYSVVEMVSGNVRVYDELRRP